ncbi:MAG: hypothetical protein NTZ39_02085 [Methanoregula sp.]|nr:hypothetical protein [Methanoregula sp.]
MPIIKAKVIDRFHLLPDNGIATNTEEAYNKSTKKRPIESLRGAWGYDIDSAKFVEKVRKSKKIEPL